MSDDPTDHERGAAMLDELEKLHANATEPPWAWEAVGEKCSTWCMGVVCDENDQPIAGEVVETYDEKTHTFSESVVVEPICEGSEHQGNAALIVAIRNAAPDLIKSARLARDLTAILCTEEEQDVLERAKALVDAADRACDFEMQRDVFCDKLNEYIDKTKEAEGEAASLRAALAENTATIANLRALFDSLQTTHEEAANLAHARGIELEGLRAELQRMKHGHYGVLRDRDTLKFATAEKDAELAKLRAQVAELQEQASMACIEPRDDCDCHGCSYAAEVHAKGEKS